MEIDDEDEQIQRALRSSLEENNKPVKEESRKPRVYDIDDDDDVTSITNKDEDVYHLYITFNKDRASLVGNKEKKN